MTVLISFVLFLKKLQFFASQASKTSIFPSASNYKELLSRAKVSLISGILSSFSVKRKGRSGVGLHKATGIQ